MNKELDAMGAVNGALPRMRRVRLVGLFGIASSIAIEVAVILGAFSHGDARIIPLMLMMGIGLLPAFFALDLMKKLQSRAILPRLAFMFGLNMPAKITRQITQNVRDRVRFGLLPDAHRLKVRSFAVGHLGKQELIYSETTVPAPGDDPDLFEGIVLILKHYTAMPEFHLVARHLIDQQRSSSLSVSTFYHHQFKQQTWSDHRLYVHHVKDTEHPLLPAIIDLHFRLANQFHASARLLCSICDGGQTQVAIQCKRSLGQIGGLFLSQARLEAQVRTLLQDFSMIYTSADLLLQAEGLVASQSAN